MAAVATQPITAFNEQTTNAEDANVFPVEQAADADATIALAEEHAANSDAAVAFTEVQAADFHDNGSKIQTASTDEMDRLIICAWKGDWEPAKNIMDGDPNLEKEVTSTFKCILLLDWARIGGQWRFFNEMLQLIPNARILTTPFEDGETILHRVAHLKGSIKSIRALVEKCPSLTQMTDSNGVTPLYTAIFNTSDSDLVWYLALVTTDQKPGRPFTGPLAADLLSVLLSVGHYDITHFLLQRHPYLAQILLTAKTTIYNKPALQPLALRPDDFPSATEFGWLARCIYSLVPVDVDDCKPPSHVIQELGDSSSSSNNHQLDRQNLETSLKRRQLQSAVWNIMAKLVPPLQRIRNTKFKHECAIKLVKIACQQTKWSLTNINDPDYHVILANLEEAAALGIIEILSIYMQFFPPPLHTSTKALRMLLRAAVENRQDKVFNFFLHTHPMINVNFHMDDEILNSLHMVAKLRYCPKITSIAGAAFQMQKELQWFKGIDKLVSPFVKQQRNKTERQTPWEFFRKEHRDMRTEGEKWMKNTANSCMLAATLIATVVFAAAFTVPGGNNQDTGSPIFLQNNTFMLFAIFDALALFSSINSLWMFLSILTARFSPEDFLETLPKRLIFGLVTLFLAIVSSMIAFGAALSLALGHRQNEVIILIVLMAFISVATFAILQLPLFIEMVRSTYSSKLLGS